MLYSTPRVCPCAIQDATYIAMAKNNDAANFVSVCLALADEHAIKTNAEVVYAGVSEPCVLRPWYTKAMLISPPAHNVRRSTRNKSRSDELTSVFSFV